MNEQSNLMKEIMAYCFAAYDWNLYLDTHPGDRLGLEMFRKMTDKAAELKSQYVQKFGPIVAADSRDTVQWTWVNDPWPWND